jgi:hypothetical protein
MSASFYQKQDITLTFRLRDINKDPWDLTGKQIVAKLIYNGTLTNFTCVISGNAKIGRCTLTLSDEETALLEAGNLPIDIYVGDYAAPPVIAPGTDTTDQIFKITDVEVLEVQAE